MLLFTPASGYAKITGILEVRNQDTYAKKVKVATAVTCPGFCRGYLEVVARPRMARIAMRPKYSCKKVSGGYRCHLARPALAFYTRCKATLPFTPELWNLMSTPEWEQHLLETGLRSVARDPAVERIYGLGWVEASSTFEATIALPYGLATPCIYLVWREIYEGPDEDCLPEFALDIREELCATERTPYTTLLSRAKLSAD